MFLDRKKTHYEMFKNFITFNLKRDVMNPIENQKVITVKISVKEMRDFRILVNAMDLSCEMQRAKTYQKYINVKVFYDKPESLYHLGYDFCRMTQKPLKIYMDYCNK